jgi:hypothetical protein
MLSVSGLSSFFNQSQVNWQNNLKQRQQDYGDLSASLQSGDLAGAQKAFSDLLQSASASLSAKGVKADFDTLGQALQSGNLNTAKSAFTKLQQDLQIAPVHSHHRAGQGAGAQSPSTNPFANLRSTASGGNSSSSKGTINITA